MMLVLAMQFSRAGWPQRPGPSRGRQGYGERQNPSAKWRRALPQNGTEDESQWSTRESTS
jgi:hypothetical protein